MKDYLNYEEERLANISCVRIFSYLCLQKHNKNKKNVKFTKIFLLSAAAAMLTGCKKELRLNENNIDEIVAAMTLEEKAALVVGIGMDSGSEGFASVIGSSADLVPGAAGSTHSIERLGIPSTILTDGPAGVRINPIRQGDSETYYCTHFPIGTLLASTWDQQLVEQVGEAMGNEVLEYGCDVLLAPAENIHRNPLNGRNFEYYSEDPVLSGLTAAAYVRGVQKNGVGTSVKHFAFNNQETNRTGNNAIISTRAQREIYLKGFELTVRESDPWTIMSSYNKSNDVYTSENAELLEKVLREDWGFKGIVMTDWYGGKDAVAQVHAGNDLLQPGRPSQYNEIIEGINDGSLSMEDLDRNVKRILQYIVRTPRFKGYQYSNKPDLKAHAQVTRQSATEGMVLLKNNQALPLTQDIKKAAVFGVTSYDFIAGGTGSGNVNRAYTVSLLDGLKNVGIHVDEDLAKKYTTYIQEHKSAEQAKLEEMGETGKVMAGVLPQSIPTEILPAASEITRAVKDNDVAIITLGRISGEMQDRTYSDFNLSQEEQQLVKNVSRAFQTAGKRCIVVLNVGGVIETASWKNTPDAILLAWQAGQEGGNSVADVLTGKANPSGKLPMTWPNSLSDHASTKNFPKAENFSIDWSAFMGVEPDEEKPLVETSDWTNYDEGIYVGYRWFDKEKMDVSYPFGFGLSYTTFDYSEADVKNDGNTLTVKVKVTNTGKIAGKEVVQLYASAPGKDMDKPVQELKAFAKTAALKPGENETVTLTVLVSDLASFSEERSAWLVEAGTYALRIGASSRDIRTTLTVDVKASEKKVNDVLHRQTTDPSIRKVTKVKKDIKTDLASLTPFLGDWKLHVTGIPTGDMDMTLSLKAEGQKVVGQMKALGMSVDLSSIRLVDGKLNYSFNFQDMNIPFALELDGDKGIKGMMMSTFKTTGEKK